MKCNNVNQLKQCLPKNEQYETEIQFIIKFLQNLH